jgi:hypothetical protein
VSEKLQDDLYDIKYMSILLDLLILLKSGQAALFGRRAQCAVQDKMG